MPDVGELPADGERDVVLAALNCANRAAQRARRPLVFQFVGRPGRPGARAVPFSVPGAGPPAARIGGFARRMMGDPVFAGQVVDAYHDYLGVAMLNEDRVVGLFAGSGFFQVHNGNVSMDSAVGTERGLLSVLALLNQVFRDSYELQPRIGRRPSENRPLVHPGFPGRDLTWDDPDVLGNGLVTMPSVPLRAPDESVLPDRHGPVVRQPLDSDSPDMRFLTKLDHPGLARIYDVVENDDTRYAVVEFTGGTSLHELARPILPLPQAIAYILGFLPVFSYLHANSLLYTDFSPRNAFVAGHRCVLVNLQSILPMFDSDTTVYCTIGFQAPEIGIEPSPASDLYTVARVLAVLTMPFAHTTDYRDSLPPTGELPLLTRFPSYDRFLRRATDRDPKRRFGHAEEMRDHLEDVLREIVGEESR